MNILRRYRCSTTSYAPCCFGMTVAVTRRRGGKEMKRVMMYLRIGLLMTMMLTAASVVRAQQRDLMTLDQAIEIAIENNRALRNATLEIEKAKDEVAATRTHRLPSFNSYT